MIRRILRGLTVGKLIRVKMDDAVVVARVHNLSDSGIWVAPSGEAGHMAGPGPGTKATVTYHDDSGNYRFTSAVISCHAVLGYLLLAWPQEVRRTQERESFRLDVNLKARWWNPESRQWINSHTRDLSAGGTLLVGEGFPDLVRVILTLPGRKIRVKARVIRMDGDAAALEFSDISRTESEAITRFIFNEQQRRRRMGLL